MGAERWVVLPLAAAVLSGLAVVAAPAEEAAVLPAVVVEADALPVTPPSVVTAPIDALNPGIVADAGELLRAIPGVSASRMGGFGLDPIVRGQSQGRLNVLLDGAVIHGGCPNRMDPATSYLPLEHYDTVTVIRGSETVRHGGGGSGGTILFERRTPRFEPGERLRASLWGGLTSNSDTQDASLDLAAGTEQGFARATGFYRTADNYEDGSGDEVRSAYETKGAGVILGWTPDEATRLTLSYDATRDRDVLYAGAGMDAPFSDSDQWRLRFEREAVVGPFAAVRGEVYRTEVTHRMDNFSLRPLTARAKMLVDSTSDTTGGRVSADLAQGDLLWTLGLDYQRLEQDATRFYSFMRPDPTVLQSHLWPGVEMDRPGLFMELEAPVSEAGLLTAGLRWDRFEASVSDAKANTVPPGPPSQRSANQLYSAYYGTTADDREDDALSGFLRYEHALDEALTLFGGLSRSVRYPDVNEAYIAANSPDPTARWVGNPDIDPEVHHQAGLGIEWGRGRWDSALSVFYDDVGDFILRDRARGQDGVLLADGATIYRNVAAVLYGGEWEGRVDWSPRWRSRATLAYVHAENRDDNRPIAQIPPLNGTLSLDYVRERWSAGALLTWSDDQSRADDDPATGSGLDAGQTPGWAVLDLYGQVRLGRHAELRAGVDNVFDRTYAYHVNRANQDPFNPDPVQVNEPGRAFWVRLGVEL